MLKAEGNFKKLKAELKTPLFYIKIKTLETKNDFKSLAGVAGFEPTNAGIKIQCLTAWRYP